MPLKIKLLIISSLLSITSFAQIDSLLLELDKVEKDSVKVSIYNEIIHISESSNEAAKYGKKALKLAMKLNDSGLIAATYQELGMVQYYVAGDYQKAIPYFEKSVELYTALKDTTLLFDNISYLGNCYLGLGEYKKCIEYGNRIVNQSKATNNYNESVILALDLISHAYVRFDEFEKAMKYAEQSYTFAKKNKLNTSIALQNIAGVHWAMGNYNQAKQYYNLAILNNKEDTTSLNYGILLSNIAGIYAFTGQYDSCLYYGLTFLEIVNNNNANKYKAKAYNIIANAQLATGELAEAKKNALFALSFYEENKHITEYMFTAQTLSEILLAQKDYAAAEKIINKGFRYLEKYSKIDKKQSVIHFIEFYNLSGKLHLVLGQPKLAIEQHLKALEYAKEINTDNDISYTYYHLAVAEKKIGKYDKAYDYAKKSIALAQQTGFRHFINDIYKLLSELAAIQNNYIDAYNYQLLYQEVQDSMLNIDKNRYLMKYFTEFQVGEKEAENQILKAEKIQNQLLLRQRTILGIAALLILGLVTAIAIILRRNNQYKAKQNEILEQQVAERTAALFDANKELEAAKVRRKLEAAKSRFFANVSHEFRTPLTLIHAPLSRILSSNTLDAKNYANAKLALQSSEQMNILINQILDLSKFDDKKLTLNESVVPFYLVFRRTVSMFESFAEQKGIRLTLEYLSDKELQVEIDKEKFNRILNNYLSNAIKYTPKNGRIIVKLEDFGSHIQLSVKDTGIGIKENLLNKVFERYYQIHNDIDTSSENVNNYAGGTGIGLSLCKEYAQLFGGKVYAKSEYGSGSTFFFEFPKKEIFATLSSNNLIAINKQSEISEINTKVAIEQKEIKNDSTSILIVEDNIDLRNFLKELLETQHQVILKENGQAALKWLSETKKQPDLIISDVMMPLMNGFELLENLKLSDTYRHIPVIMLTAIANIQDKLKALRIGVDDYILKPFNDIELQTRIDNILNNLKQRQLFLEKDSTEIGSKDKILNVSKEEHKWLKSLEDCIFNHIERLDLNADFIANQLFISRSTLFRKTKQLTGLTFNQYINETRLQKAKELLENGKVDAVKKLSYSVGFKHVSYFSKIFEQRFGKLPSKYL